jgi:NAD(P)-dependent dehydrogenase (short-subunit alcohol dehydrogenase family)
MGMMDGKAVLVTGAGRGISLGMAEPGAVAAVNDLGISMTGEGQKWASPADQVPRA